MITNLLKTAGLCLTSLTSFLNTPQEQAETTTEEISFYLDESIGNNKTFEDINIPLGDGTVILGNRNNQYTRGTYSQNGISIETLYLSTAISIQKTNIGTEEISWEYLYSYGSMPKSFAIQIFKIQFNTSYLYTGYIDEYYTLIQNPLNIDITTRVYIYESITENKTERWLNADIATLNNTDQGYIESIYNDLIANNNLTAWDLANYREITSTSEERYTYNTELNAIYTKPLYILALTLPPAEELSMLNNAEHDTVLFYHNINTKTLFSFTKTTPSQALYMEVVDVPDIMFTVLGMPFTFMSIAFNLTLFKGTPYQINISALFLAILGILIMMWLITFIAGKLK